ncbi:hypothetical protein RJ640_011902 [Escallonia rubra]|uniref:Uncharacterized protein n=1 Tax=Escallonia rubra TaxID=112253 RepID=A0AA88RHI2_9ASTE|nr:hypothetical protein RJ640_011902 [Escallonia rubra]
MKLESTSTGEMALPLYSSRTPMPWIAALISFLTYAKLSGHGFFSLFMASMVLILSIVVLKFLKRKPVLLGKSDQDLTLCRASDQNGSLQVEEEVVSKLLLLNGTQSAGDKVEEAQETEVDQLHDYLVGSKESDSETESTSEDSDIDWPYSGNVGCSDDSISDEESLIEIALPSGHYVSPKEEEEPKFNLQHKLPNFSPDTIFAENGLKELYSEINDMNEEENLIEIDISMGSIICSRFEINV